MGKIGTELGRHWRATKAARACRAKILDRREMSGRETDIPCHLPARGMCWLVEGSRAQAESSSSVWGAVLQGWGVKQKVQFRTEPKPKEPRTWSKGNHKEELLFCISFSSEGICQHLRCVGPEPTKQAKNRAKPKRLD